MFNMIGYKRFIVMGSEKGKELASFYFLIPGAEIKVGKWGRI